MNATAHHDSDQPRCTHGRFMAAGTHACHCTTPPRPRLSLVKSPTIPVIPPPTTSSAPKLPTRPRTTAENDGRLAFAQHAATTATIHTRVTGWLLRPDGTAYQYLPDGTLLSHPGTYRAPLTALTSCSHGAIHADMVTSPATLKTALTAARTCTNPHLISRAYTVIPLHHQDRTHA